MLSNKTVSYFKSFVNNLPHLRPREKFVLKERLDKKTLQKLGSEWGVTEARVRQIEKSAIQKLKSKIRQLSLFDKKSEENLQ